MIGGNEIVIGTGESKYDKVKKVVESQSPPIRLAVDGKKMEGALMVGGRGYRRIYLEKEK